MAWGRRRRRRRCRSTCIERSRWCWRRDGDADDDAYSAKELREIFETFGRIEDVVIREGKKKKGSALVVFADGDAWRHGVWGDVWAVE